MWQVNNQLDRLDVCIVGKAHNPQYYDDDLAQKIADETNEDLDALARFLESFNVTVLRPNDINHNLSAIVTPRDYLGMIGNRLFVETYNTNWNDIRGKDWPENAPINESEWNNLPLFVKQELTDIFKIHSLTQLHKCEFSNIAHIVDAVSTTNTVIRDTKIDTAMVCRLDNDLIIGTWNNINYLELIKKYFPDYNIHVVNSEGHLDGTIAVVHDNLLIARDDTPVNIPGMEVFYVKQTKHSGNPETYFDVNMLLIDRNNIICLEENLELFKKLEEYNITPHVLKFRHSRYWDAGFHCVTSDLNRINTI